MRVRYPNWVILPILIWVAVLCHLILVPVGFEFLNGDSAPVNLVADEFLKGKFSAFYFDLPYGGVTLTLLRALWVLIYETLASGPSAHLMAHMSFSFVICPVLMTVAVYYLVASYCTRFAAICVGLTAAIGFQSWVQQYGNDVYIAYLLFGTFLLAWKSKVRNPLLDLSPFALFSAAALSGLAFYTSRASAFYILVFFLPWDWFVGEVKRVLSPRGRIEKILLYSSVALFFLFYYLELFGPDMGEVLGKKLRVHAQPNFNYALYLLIILEVKIRWKQVRKIHFERSFIFIAGFITGLTPEIFHYLSLGQLPPPGMGDGMKFTDVMSTVGTLPSSLQFIFAAGTGFGRNASVALVLLGFVSLFLRVRRDRRFQPIVLVAALTAFAYCRYHTYTFASPRYLLPILPAAMVAMGCFWDEIARRGRAFLVFALVLLAGHGMHQWNARVRTVADVKDTPRLMQGLEIVERFQAAGVALVISDEYWFHSNSYSLLSRGKPVFLQPDNAPGLRPAEGLSLVRVVKVAGMMLKTEPSISQSSLLRKSYGRDWNLKLLAREGEYSLFIAQSD